MKSVFSVLATTFPQHKNIVNYNPTLTAFSWKSPEKAAVARLQMRKEQAGLGHRDDIKCFVAMLDADEKRF